MNDATQRRELYHDGARCPGCGLQSGKPLHYEASDPGRFLDASDLECASCGHHWPEDDVEQLARAWFAHGAYCLELVSRHCSTLDAGGAGASREHSSRVIARAPGERDEVDRMAASLFVTPRLAAAWTSSDSILAQRDEALVEVDRLRAVNEEQRTRLDAMTARISELEACLEEYRRAIGAPGSRQAQRRIGVNRAVTAQAELASGHQDADDRVRGSAAATAEAEMGRRAKRVTTTGKHPGDEEKQ